MKAKTKKLIANAWYECHKNRKSFEYSLQYVQDTCNVDLDCVLDFLEKHSMLQRFTLVGIKLDYDEWLGFSMSRINEELAESGADREMGFDAEREYEKRYESYCDSFNDNVVQKPGNPGRNAKHPPLKKFSWNIITE